MKFLVGIISGIVLAVGGVAYASDSHQATAATNLAQINVTPQVVPLAVPQKQAAVTRVEQFAGELTRKDSGAFELKIGERDLRIVVTHAKVTNLAGRPVALPLDAAGARIIGKLLPRSAWRLDDDGHLLPTFAANRIIVIATTPQETDQTNG